MPIATDPLSLVFISCFLFGLLFLLVTALLGNLGHGHAGGHVGTHSVHVGGHASSSHVVGHSTHASSSHVVGHSTHVTGHGPTHAAGQTTKSQQVTNDNQGNAFSLLAFVNPTSIVVFLLGFGFFGYVFHNTTPLMLPLTLLLAGIGGLIIAGLLLWLLERLFGDSEGATVQDVSDRTGLLGKVSIPIQENSLGEIIYTSPGGMRKSIPARSVDGHRLERGQEVVVVNYQNGVAEVNTWDSFINSEEAPQSQWSASNEDELAKLRTLLEASDTTTHTEELVMRKDLQKE